MTHAAQAGGGLLDWPHGTAVTTPGATVDVDQRGGWIRACLRLGSVAVVLSAAVACTADSGGAESALTPTAGPGPSTTTYTSARLRYSLDVPDDRHRFEAYIDWRMGAPPHRGTPPFDTYVAPATADPWFLVGRMPVETGTTLGAWIDELRSSGTITYPDLCDPVSREEDAVLGGEPARLFELRCPRDFPRAVGVQIFTVHRDSGYHVICYSEETLEGNVAQLRDDCLRWLRTLQFGD